MYLYYSIGGVKKHRFTDVFILVGEVGLEPTRLIQSTDFKSVAYTNSATRPNLVTLYFYHDDCLIHRADGNRGNWYNELDQNFKSIR